MKQTKRRNRFWQMWAEAQETAGEDVDEIGFDHRRAWRGHFVDFFGVAQEKHWLFSGRRFKPWVSGRCGPAGMFNPFVAMLMSKGGGLLSLLVFHLLAEKPRYGNDIMREIEDRTHGRWGSNPGAVYPLLNAMQESGFVHGEWEDPEKRTRRIYNLTPTGRKELERLKEVMRPKLEEAIDVLRHLNDELDIDEEV